MSPSNGAARCVRLVGSSAVNGEALVNFISFIWLRPRRSRTFSDKSPQSHSHFNGATATRRTPFASNINWTGWSWTYWWTLGEQTLFEMASVQH